MKCAIHQPQFLPWLGYLHKIHSVAKFVFLDNVQFKKNEFQNRNRLLISGAARWLTVPVSFSFGASLRETRVVATIPWRKKMMHTLELNYAQAPYFRQFREGLAQVINQEWQTIAELNVATVRWLMGCFEVRTEVQISSQLSLINPPETETGKHWIPDQVGNDNLASDSVIPVPALSEAEGKTGIQNMRGCEVTGQELNRNPTGRLIEICRRVGADTYLSGVGGHEYLEEAEFKKAGIKLEFQDFTHPVYPQHSRKEGAAFIPNLSAVDGLFNCGGGAAGRKRLNIEMQQ